MSGQTKTRRFLFFLVLITASLSLPVGTLAQSETPYDLVNAVNNLRALRGLAPYQVDPWLMAYAQEHTDYQASTQTSTHEHSDGSLPQDIGLQENVAGGDARVVTVAIVVYEIWVDWGHRHILIGYATGDIGAGMAIGKNGLIYYTVNIRPGGEAATAPTRAGTSAPFVPLQTSTPHENGSIIHLVRNGEALWSIAQSYGVTVDDIHRLNAMAADSTMIYAGQKLLIRPANAGTPTLPDETSPVLTQSPDATTRRITETLAPTETFLPTPSHTATPAGIPSDTWRRNISIGSLVGIAIGVMGLLIAVILGFSKPREDLGKD